MIVSAPVGTAHDFNHSLAPSSKDPPFQGMSDTIAGDPHCFSGSTSSTVPSLLGTPGYLSSHGMMEQPMHELQTQSTIVGDPQPSGSDMITVTHPPGIPGYLSPHGMQSWKFSATQHAEWMSSYKWTHTKYGQSLQWIWHKSIIGSTMIYINFWW